MPTVTFMNLSKEKKDKIIKAAKKEFSRVPISEVLIKNIVEDVFKKSSEFFDVDYILKLLSDHKEGKKDNSRKVWTIYSFLIWYQEYFVER